MTDYRALADYTALGQRVAGCSVWLAVRCGWLAGVADGAVARTTARGPRENDQWPEEGLPAVERKMPSS